MVEINLKERLKNKTFKSAFIFGLIFLLSIMLIIIFAIQPIHLGTYYYTKIDKTSKIKIKLKMNEEAEYSAVKNNYYTEYNLKYSLDKDNETNRAFIKCEFIDGDLWGNYNKSTNFIFYYHHEVYYSGYDYYINYFALARLIVYIIISVISLTILIFKLIKYRKSQLVFDTDKRTGNDLA